jgi:hypothetical protein
MKFVKTHIILLLVLSSAGELMGAQEPSEMEHVDPRVVQQDSMIPTESNAAGETMQNAQEIPEGQDPNSRAGQPPPQVPPGQPLPQDLPPDQPPPRGQRQAVPEGQPLPEGQQPPAWDTQAQGSAA